MFKRLLSISLLHTRRHLACLRHLLGKLRHLRLGLLLSRLHLLLRTHAATHVATKATTHVGSVGVVAGIITVTPTATTDVGATLILTPTLNAGGLPMTWSNAGSGCLTSSPILCTAAGTASAGSTISTEGPNAENCYDGLSVYNDKGQLGISRRGPEGWCIVVVP